MPLAWCALRLPPRLVRRLRLLLPSRPFPVGARTSPAAPRPRPQCAPARLRRCFEAPPLRAQTPQPAPPPAASVALVRVPTPSSLNAHCSRFTHSSPPHSPHVPRRPAQKSGPSYLSPARPPLGVALARDSSPFTPTQFPALAAPHHPASGYAKVSLEGAGWGEGGCHPPHPSRGNRQPCRPHSFRSPISAELRPAAPQEFFGKNSYCARGALASPRLPPGRIA